MHPLATNGDQLTLRQLVGYLGVDERTIRRWTAAGYLKPTRKKLGYATIYSLKQVMAGVAKHNLHVDPAAIEAFNQGNN